MNRFGVLLALSALPSHAYVTTPYAIGKGGTAAVASAQALSNLNGISRSGDTMNGKFRITDTGSSSTIPANNSFYTSGGVFADQNLALGGADGASPGSGGTIFFYDDTKTRRWQWGLQGNGGATEMVLRDVVSAVNVISIAPGGVMSMSSSLINAGNVTLSTAGNGISIKEGSNAKMGVATLVAGTVTVSTTAVTANSRIFMAGQNSSDTHGELTVSARTAGTSFTITSVSALDTRDVAWVIFEPSP